ELATVALVSLAPRSEITISRYDKRTIRLRQIIPAQSIAAIRQLRRHHPRKTKTLRDFSIDVEKWWIDPQVISRQAGQSLDVKWRSGFRVFPDPENMICSKDENIATVWL